jgi:hypothetical protein
MVHQEVGWGAIEWIDLAQERDTWQALVNAVMDLRVPLSAENFLTSRRLVSFSRRTVLSGVSKNIRLVRPYSKSISLKNS